MIRYSEKDGALVFSVRVVPKASSSVVVGEHDGALRVRVAVPPVDGAANEELARTLARAFKVAVHDVTITRGHSSKLKQIRISGITREQLEKLTARN